MPHPEPFVGGFSPLPGQSQLPDISRLSVGEGPPSPPPKDDRYQNSIYSSVGSPPSIGPAWSQSTYDEPPAQDPWVYPTQHLAHMSPVERSQNLRVASMHPILQFMAGPLLRYDTVTEDGVWHGAAMVVSERTL